MLEPVIDVRVTGQVVTISVVTAVVMISEVTGVTEEGVEVGWTTVVLVLSGGGAVDEAADELVVGLIDGGGS